MEIRHQLKDLLSSIEGSSHLQKPKGRVIPCDWSPPVALHSEHSQYSYKGECNENTLRNEVCSKDISAAPESLGLQEKEWHAIDIKNRCILVDLEIEYIIESEGNL